MKTFEYKHTISFDETNIVGNTYFAHFFHWQGKCREKFLRVYYPEILNDFDAGLALVTTDSNCNFYKELFAFDEVLVEMKLSLLKAHRCRMQYNFFRMNADCKELVAKGEQGVICMRKTDGEFSPEPFPEKLYMAMEALKNGGNQKIPRQSKNMSTTS